MKKNKVNNVVVTNLDVILQSNLFKIVCSCSVVLIIAYMILHIASLGGFIDSLEKNNEFYKSPELEQCKVSTVSVGSKEIYVDRDVDGHTERIYLEQDDIFYCNIEDNCLLKTPENKYLLALSISDIFRNGHYNYKGFAAVLASLLLISAFLIYYIREGVMRRKYLQAVLFISLLLFSIITTAYTIGTQVYVFGKDVVNYWTFI